ncbi:MAG TPA: hypothetical protein PK297_10175 [Spirochaetota bacterium]|nr:hypothetical protein [Spirochaetota bacterium]
MPGDITASETGICAFSSAIVAQDNELAPEVDEAAWLDADEAAAEDDETAEKTDPVVLDWETAPDDTVWLDADETAPDEDWPADETEPEVLDASPEIADETEIIEELLPAGGTRGSSSEQAETKTKPVRAQATKRPEKKLRMNTP